jgi:FdhE protein
VEQVVHAGTGIRKGGFMKSSSGLSPDQIRAAFGTAQKQNAPYRVWYPFLEALFLAQAAGKKRLQLELPELDPLGAQTRWEAGFPLLQRWDFPVDIELAEELLAALVDHLPAGNEPLRTAHAALTAALANHRGEHREFWASFLQHEQEPWEAWIDVGEGGAAPLIFWGRACLRPSLEWTAEQLLERFPLPESWQKGYCPICGSLPALLYLHGEGERQAFCSWCGTEWGLSRLQCPHCDNRDHDSLGYLYPEGEPNYRVQYCRSCRMYFKLVDQRELLAPLFLPLEEWTTLHLDFLAQREGWQQPPSPAPTLYGG